MNPLQWIAILICLTGPCAALSGDEQPAVSDPGVPPMRTLGGRQFWGDVLFFHDWSIQQNVFTKHYRLLDGGDVRFTFGSYDECHQKLQQIIAERKLAPMSGKAVILVHGIIRSSKSFESLRNRLSQEGYQVFPFDYPSTRIPIPEAARYLERVIESLEGIEEINFVVHSMGGLVVRSYLQQADPPDPRLGRMVMLGVPNLGATMADKFREVGLFRLIFGPAGQQLVTDAEGLIPNLPIPHFEFGIVAGARGDDKGFNPLIPGDDDGTVELARTRLPGASDFLTVKTLHSFLMGDATVIDACARFLSEGRFRAVGERQPIPQTAPASEPSAAPPAAN